MLACDSGRLEDYHSHFSGRGILRSHGTYPVFQSGHTRKNQHVCFRIYHYSEWSEDISHVRIWVSRRRKTSRGARQASVVSFLMHHGDSGDGNSEIEKDIFATRKTRERVL